MQILALCIAISIPILALYLIYRLDLYKTGEFRTIVICLFAGLVAFELSSVINRTTMNQGWLTNLDVIRYSAPVVEEILKGLVLWYLVRRPKFTYFVEGAVYGFAAGIGFAIFENFEYILADPGSALPLAIGRVISTNLIHATTCSLLGIALGYARLERKSTRINSSLLGLLVAILLHMSYNNLVTRVDRNWILIYAFAAGITGAGFIAFTLQRGLKEEKAWIEEKLGMTDRVTSGEVAVIERLDQLQEILKPLVERFGNKKASQIEHFLIIQARLGILRKSLDKLSDERMTRSVEAQMAKLRTEVDDARREVGSYAMLYLRHTIPEDASPLWGRLETAIQERAATRMTNGGMNLWANLRTRQAEQRELAAESKQEDQG